MRNSIDIHGKALALNYALYGLGAGHCLFLIQEKEFCTFYLMIMRYAVVTLVPAVERRGVIQLPDSSDPNEPLLQYFSSSPS